LVNFKKVSFKKLLKWILFIFCADEYLKVTGERIPFRQLGFSSLETLLQSSGKFTIQNYGGGAIVQALATNKTQHLTELIKKQKSKPPKKKPVSVNSNKLNIINCYQFIFKI